MENAVLALRDDRTGELNLLYFRGPTCQMFNTMPSFRRVCCATRDCVMEQLRRGKNLTIDGLSFTLDNGTVAGYNARVIEGCVVCLQRASVEISLQSLVISFEQSQLVVASSEAKVSCFDTELSILQRGVPSCFSIVFPSADQAWEAFQTMRFARFITSAAGRHYNWLDDEELMTRKDSALPSAQTRGGALPERYEQGKKDYPLNVLAQQQSCFDSQHRVSTPQQAGQERRNFAQQDARADKKALDAQIQPLESPQVQLPGVCDLKECQDQNNLTAASPTPLVPPERVAVPGEQQVAVADSTEVQKAEVQAECFQPVEQQPSHQEAGQQSLDEQLRQSVVNEPFEAKPAVASQEASQSPPNQVQAKETQTAGQPTVVPNNVQEKEDYAAYRSRYLKAQFSRAAEHEPNSSAQLLKTPPYMADQTLSYLSRAREFVRQSPEQLRDIEQHIARLQREITHTPVQAAARNFERVVPAVSTARNDFRLSSASPCVSRTRDTAIPQQPHSQVYSALSMIAAQAQNATDHFCESAAPMSSANSTLLKRQHEDFYGHLADEAKRYVAELESDRNIRLQFSPQAMKGIQQSSVLATEIPAEAPRRTSNCRASSEQQTAEINVSAINSTDRPSVMHESSEEDLKGCQKGKRRWWTQKKQRK